MRRSVVVGTPRPCSRAGPRSSAWTGTRPPSRRPAHGSRAPSGSRRSRDRAGELESLLGPPGLLPVDGVLLDLGVSSPAAGHAGAGLQLPDRGSARHADGPDRRDRGRADRPAVGARARGRATGARRGALREAHRARRSSRTCPRRTRTRSSRSKRAVPRKAWPSRVHVATRTFQALRIAVNDEVGELERVLSRAAAAPARRRPGGGHRLPQPRGSRGEAGLPRARGPLHLSARAPDLRCGAQASVEAPHPTRGSGLGRRGANAIPGRAARDSGPWRGWHEPERRGRGRRVSLGAVLGQMLPVVLCFGLLGGGRHPPRRLAEPGGGRRRTASRPWRPRAAPSPWPTTGCKLELATLKRPSRLEAIARGQLGMGPPDASAVDSVAAPARAAAVPCRRGSAHAGGSPLAAMSLRRSSERGRPPAELTRWTRARVLVMGGMLLARARGGVACAR